MVKANVDKILDMLSEKKSLSSVELSRSLKIKEDDILKSAEYLEQDGVVKIERKWPRTIITLNPKKNSQTTVPPPPPMAPSINPNMPPPPKLMTMPGNTPLPDIKKYSPDIKAETKIQAQPQNNIISMPSQSIEIVKPTFNQETSINAAVPIENNSQNTEKMQNLGEAKMPIPPSSFTSNDLDKTLFDLKKEPSVLATSPEENVKLAKTVMVDKDPLEETPHFDMRPPAPNDLNKLKEYFENAEDQKNGNNNLEFPSYIRTDVERITYILDNLTQKLNSRDYKDINSYYRNIFNLYNESVALSNSEKYALGEKINEVFERIKNIYLIEKAI